MTKSKETIVWQHFNVDNKLENETTTEQMLYRRKDGTCYVNYLDGIRTIKEDKRGRFVAFGSKVGRVTSFPEVLQMIKGKQLVVS